MSRENLGVLVLCDEVGCSAGSVEEKDDAETLALLVADGWSFIGGKDLCPKHSCREAEQCEVNH